MQQSESSENEEVVENQHADYVRQDLYVVFTHERELRNVDQIRIKISQFTGVVIRLKQVTQQTMENLIAAIEADAANFQMQQSMLQFPKGRKISSQPVEMGGLQENTPFQFQTPTSGIVNLRFEDSNLSSKAVQLLKHFLSQKQLIESFFIQKVEFQDPVSDFRQLMEGVQYSLKIKKAGVIGMLFDDESYGKTLCHMLNDCKHLREFDASYCEFFHPKCFFDMCQSLISEKSRVTVLKLKGVQISNLEGKVLQFVLMKNKSLHTMDISYSKVDSGECLDFFLQKLDKYSNIRHLILDGIQPDLCGSLELLGDSISENTKLEVLIMRENKLKWNPYSSFWENMKGNKSLQKINVSKTDLTDRVLEKLCYFLVEPGTKLVDLDLSRNQITDVGLQNLSESLLTNQTIKYLNLSQNGIKDASGIQPLVNYLSQPNCTLVELSLTGNKINGDGIHCLASFLKPNTSLKMLDISKNNYQDQAFSSFALEMGQDATLTFLDISKSKDLNDEGSLIVLAQQLAFNTHLQTLDLSAVRVRKPFLKQHLEPSLQKNITLKYVLGKLTPDIIDEQLNINIQIQTDVEPNYTAQVMPTKIGAIIHKSSFDVKLVDPCNSLLKMKGQSSSLFEATFKFMRQKDVRQVDLTGMDLMDGQLYLLANYLQEVPNLRSLILNNNKNITDDGLLRIALALTKNNKLAHLSITGCPNLGNDVMKVLARILTEDNTMLCSVEFNEDQFDLEIGDQVKLETKLNRAIQRDLKPSFYFDGAVKPEVAGGKTDEVVFVDNAPVHLYLSSAIKCWRNSQPFVIQIENQQLTDAHVVELCDFLKDRNMILNLNLRRNLITNDGALNIIDWITNHDTALTHLDVSRNRITRAGAQAFLEALQKQTRIIDFQIAYGNPIPLDISLAISQEILANNQIKANQSENPLRMQITNKVTLTAQRYELIDRGPNFMRCAIKSVELCKIRHLSLPDNMLGLEEAKMIAAMIKVNPPLTTLNLETNNLDAQCARLLGEALESNDNLQMLNISQNKLSDLGISYLLQPLIKARLFTIKLEEAEKKLKEAEAKDNFSEIPSTPKSGDDQPAKQLPFSPKGQQSRNQRRQIVSQSLSSQEVDEPTPEYIMLLTETIEKCEFGQLKVLNLCQNRATLESYKVISTLMQINPSIVLMFDDPACLLLSKPPLPQVSQTVGQSQPVLESPPSPNSQRDTNRVVEKPQNAQVTIVKNKHRLVQACLDRNNRVKVLVLKFTKYIFCYQPEKLLNMTTIDNPTLWLVMCWRIHYWRQCVSNFSPEINLTIKFNSKPKQNLFVGLMLLTQFLLYCFMVVPYLMNFGNPVLGGIVLACFLLFVWIFEQFMIFTSNIKVSIINPYLQVQVMAGLLNKAALVSVGIMGGLCLKSGELGGLILAVFTFCLVIVDQYRTVAMGWQSLRASIDHAAVLPYLERSQKLAEVLKYKGILIMFQKVTLLPSEDSKHLSQKIACELNPDLIRAPPSRWINRLSQRVLITYLHNVILRHLILINIPLVLVIVVGLIFDWYPFTVGLFISILSWVLDFTFLIVQLCDKSEYSKVSFDTNKIFEKAMSRNTDLFARYTEVLMREKQFEITPRQELELPEISEHDYLDTKNSNCQAAEQGETTIPQIDMDRLLQQPLSPKQNGESENLVFQSRTELLIDEN